VPGKCVGDMVIVCFAAKVSQRLDATH